MKIFSLILGLTTLTAQAGELTLSREIILGNEHSFLIRKNNVDPTARAGTTYENCNLLAYSRPYGIAAQIIRVKARVEKRRTQLGEDTNFVIEPLSSPIFSRIECYRMTATDRYVSDSVNRYRLWKFSALSLEQSKGILSEAGIILNLD